MRSEIALFEWTNHTSNSGITLHCIDSVYYILVQGLVIAGFQIFQNFHAAQHFQQILP